MAYYTRGVVGPRDQPLENFPSSAGAAISAAARDAWVGNPTNVLLDWTEIQRLNRAAVDVTDRNQMTPFERQATMGLRRPGGVRWEGEEPPVLEKKLSQAEAQAYFKEAGVELSAPSSGLTRPAADALIERKREENIRKDILNRAPGGFTQTGARLGVGLAVSLLDPLNVASAFVPVVGPARYAAMLERAGVSALARAGVRARVGAVEGAAGAAMLEPLVYAGRTQLQDDYDMTDSLLNVAFGTVLGGGLHVVGGRIADYITPPVRQIEARIAADEPIISPESISSPAPRTSPPPRLELARPDPVAPFARLADLTPDNARRLAVAELEPEIRAQLSTEAARTAEPGAIKALNNQAAELRATLSRLQSDSHFRAVSKQAQRSGLSRKQAEASARRTIGEEVASTQEALRAVDEQIDMNRSAARAQQDIARLDKGEVPERFAEQVQTRANQLQMQAAIQGAFPARHLVAMAAPQARQDALRIAVAQGVSGKQIDVDAVIRGDEQGILEAARRQASPESAAGADFQAAEASTAKLADPVARADTAAAQSDLDAAMQQFDDAIKNLEQGGFDPQRIERIRQELAAFDEMQADAKALASATRAAAVCGLRG